MATKSPKAEIAVIDCVLVTVTPESPSNADTLAFDTASQIEVEPQLEETDAITVMVKGVLKAQKPPKKVLTGNTITLHDNVFLPELVKILQGGTIKYDQNDNTKIIGYTPPVAGSNDTGTPFTLIVYSAHYNAAGLIVDYEKISYPHCQGNPMAFGVEDGVFRAPEYSIFSAPDTGEAPYDIDYVSTLPTVT